MATIPTTRSGRWLAPIFRPPSPYNYSMYLSKGYPLNVLRTPPRPDDVTMDECPPAQPPEPHTHPYFRNAYHHNTQQLLCLKQHKIFKCTHVPFWESYSTIYDHLPLVVAWDTYRAKTCLREEGMPMACWSRGLDYLRGEGVMERFEAAFGSIEATGDTNDRVMLAWLSSMFSMEDLMAMGGDFGKFNFVVNEVWPELTGECKDLLYAWLIWIHWKVLDVMPVEVFVNAFYVYVEEECRDFDGGRYGPRERMVEIREKVPGANVDVPTMRLFRRNDNSSEPGFHPAICTSDYRLHIFLHRCYDINSHTFQLEVVIPTVRRLMRLGVAYGVAAPRSLVSAWFSSCLVRNNAVKALKRSWVRSLRRRIGESDWWMHFVETESTFSRKGDKERNVNGEIINDNDNNDDDNNDPSTSQNDNNNNNNNPSTSSTDNPPPPPPPPTAPTNPQLPPSSSSPATSSDSPLLKDLLRRKHVKTYGKKKKHAPVPVPIPGVQYIVAKAPKRSAKTAAQEKVHALGESMAEHEQQQRKKSKLLEEIEETDDEVTETEGEDEEEEELLDLRHRRKTQVMVEVDKSSEYTAGTATIEAMMEMSDV